MTSSRWNLITLLAVLAGLVFMIVASWIIDPFGVLRDPTGRKLYIFSSEGKAHYFMGQRYVPKNFNGLLIGPSNCVNWDVSSLADSRIYNEGIQGGNATEEKIVVDQALSRGHYKLAIVLLYPSMTQNHNIEDGLDQIAFRETLGSFQLFDNEVGSLLKHYHFKYRKGDVAPNGQIMLLYHRDHEIKSADPEMFRIDPTALADLVAMIQELKKNGASVLYLVPPLYEPYYQANHIQFDNYLQAIRQLLPPAPVINLDAQAFTPLRSDPDNYFDCCHLEPQGTKEVVSLLQQLVPQALSGN